MYVLALSLKLKLKVSQIRYYSLLYGELHAAYKDTTMDKLPIVT